MGSEIGYGMRTVKKARTKNALNLLTPVACCMAPDRHANTDIPTLGQRGASQVHGKLGSRALEREGGGERV